jgi:nitrogen regulatory protein PII-like uncharacterized protein
VTVDHSEESSSRKKVDTEADPEMEVQEMADQETEVTVLLETVDLEKAVRVIVDREKVDLEKEAKVDLPVEKMDVAEILLLAQIDLLENHSRNLKLKHS